MKLCELDEVLYEVDASSENWMIAGGREGTFFCPLNKGDQCSRIVISILCMPLVAGYVWPPQLGLPDVGEGNISCNPLGPHFVCLLPPALSSSYCIPA
ncbi:TRAPP II complex TRAPPC10, C-terminal [Dillenia turbinata]|uniref:TRAPP II complex TRAPPC10, C-terminal n=1 Tax=Dillenia turbinata TaxID=194707 RepID=A0AAN8ZE03_9MAGN